MSEKPHLYEHSISHVSFETGDEENDDFSDESYFSDESRKKAMRRKRTSSVFSIEDYLSLRNERINSLSLKGECVVTHSDIPTIRVQHETSLGYFEQGRLSRGNNQNRSNSIFSEFSKDRRGKSLLSNSSNVSAQKNYNTYELEPVNAFDTAKVKSILLEEFDKVRHLPAVNQNIICLGLTNDIKRRVKLLGFSRYKYVVMVTMGENKHQGVNMSSRFFWDDKNDSYISHSLKLKEYFMVGVIYAIYCL